jgi:hypothetical protein
LTSSLCSPRNGGQVPTSPLHSVQSCPNKMRCAPKKSHRNEKKERTKEIETRTLVLFHRCYERGPAEKQKLPAPRSPSAPHPATSAHGAPTLTPHSLRLPQLAPHSICALLSAKPFLLCSTQAARTHLMFPQGKRLPPIGPKALSTSFATAEAVRVGKCGASPARNLASVPTSHNDKSFQSTLVVTPACNC